MSYSEFDEFNHDDKAFLEHIKLERESNNRRKNIIEYFLDSSAKHGNFIQLAILTHEKLSLDCYCDEARNIENILEECSKIVEHFEKTQQFGFSKNRWEYKPETTKNTYVQSILHIIDIQRTLQIDDQQICSIMQLIIELAEYAEK